MQKLHLLSNFYSTRIMKLEYILHSGPLCISIFTSTIYLMELDCDGGLSLVLEMTFDFKCFPNLIGRYGNR